MTCRETATRAMCVATNSLAPSGGFRNPISEVIARPERLLSPTVQRAPAGSSVPARRQQGLRMEERGCRRVYACSPVTLHRE